MFRYIVSLTTIPSKFDKLYLTIDSIIIQTVLPDKIIINIPRKYNFRVTGEISLEKINNFIDKYSKYNVFINFVDIDYGPGTKLLGLFNTEIPSNTYIVLIDDDLIYKPFFIERFDSVAKSNNIEVGSFYVYNYHINIGQGADGYFIKSDNLSHYLQYYNTIKDQDYILYHDDFYMSYYFHLIRKQIHHIRNDSLVYEVHSEIDALSKLTGKYNRNNLNVQSNELLNKLNQQGLFGFL